ncbi:MAG: cation-translocating P-type ATPase [Firmicutes bacterium]|nr:cation-translocating P-type ATPase [Bacillota bacterium]
MQQWPLMSATQVCEQLRVNPEGGLSGHEISARRNKWGRNLLIKGRSPSLLGLFISQCGDFLVLVLLAATLISGLLGEYADALTIIIIVLLNAILGTVQEYRAERSLKALHDLAAPHANVLRDGTMQVIGAEEIVPGDILAFEAGDRVCADIRLLDTQSLVMNEASLTGESVPVGKSVRPLGKTPPSLGDVNNMIFSGTLVAGGRGRGVVVATGMNTQLGEIAHLIEHAEKELTPLQKRLGSLGRLLVMICLVICGVVVFLGILRGEPIYGMFMAGVSLAVAAIPEGLPAIVTVSLALGVQRMARRKAIVRRLPAVETLGSATVICSDKTGTLTQNCMVLREVYTQGARYIKEEGEPWKKKGEPVIAAEEAPLTMALKIGLLCSNVLLQKEGEVGGWGGDPTEIALVEAAGSAGIRSISKRLLEIPFTAERKMMTVVVKDRGLKAMVKGAPEVILQRCGFILDGSRIRSFAAGEKERILDRVERMAGTALRILAVACRDLTGQPEASDRERIERGLVWVGLLGLEDPPRAEVFAAIRTCHKAGIKVVMVTGDHRSTAEAIGRRLNILKDGLVLSGEELDQLGEQALYRIIEQVEIFTRVNPAHKLRVVRALKKRGHVVAMTGDGVNDAPAVKEADIGVAMGISGTEVTREAASLVLEDDNFASIVAAVEEGRNIYANVRKFIRFLLGCNTGEILTMFISILIGLPLPLRPLQILWINLITDGLPALALGMEPPDEEIMKSPPQKRERGIFSGALWGRILLRGVVIAISAVAVFVVVLNRSNNLLQAQTATLATLILTQLIIVFECRTEKIPFWTARTKPNYYLYAAVFCSLSLLYPVIYIPAIRNIFQTLPLAPESWALIALFSLLPYPMMWLGSKLMSRSN